MPVKQVEVALPVKVMTVPMWFVLLIVVVPVSLLSSPFMCEDNINPLVTNGLSYPYHLNESTFICKVIGSKFSF